MSSNDATAQQTQNAIKSDPDANSRLIEGNLVWRAMKKGGLDTFLGEKELRMAMSVTGAVVFARPPDADPTDRPQLSYIGKTITFDKLLGANTAGADEPRILTCLDGTGEEGCTVLGDEPYDGKPFSQLAYEKMKEIYDKIVNRDKLDAGQIAFVENTSVPVYRMLAVAASLPSDSVAIDQMLKNSDVIGAELAAAFLMKALDDVEKGLNSRSMIAAKAEVETLDQIRRAIQERRQEILTRKVVYTNKVNSIGAMMQEVAFLEKAYMGNLSDGLAANLRFSRSMRMNGG